VDFSIDLSDKRDISPGHSKNRIRETEKPKRETMRKLADGLGTSLSPTHGACRMWERRGGAYVSGKT